jgi:hypothetical protein
MIRRLLYPATLALALALTAACGDDDGGTTSTSRTVRPGPPAPTVGIGELDQLIRAAYAGDEIELAALTGYASVPCTESDNPDLGRPACREDEEENQQVQVLPASSCENGWVRPEQAPDLYAANLPDSGVNLYAIFLPNIGFTTFGGGFGATHVLVFEPAGDGGDGDSAGAALWVDGGRIVWVRSICDSFDELIDPDEITSFLREPAEGAAEDGETSDSEEPAESTPSTSATPSDAQ